MKSLIIKVLKWVFIIFIGVPVVIGAVIAIFQGKNDDREKTVEKEMPENSIKDQKEDNKQRIKDKIAHEAFIPMTQEIYPKSYKKWGKDGFARINQLGPIAAEIAAKSKVCDKVIDVSLSDAKSTPKSKIVFFVDCNNNERLYISESDIKNQKTPLSVSEEFKIKKKNASKYYEDCLATIKLNANFPSTVDSSILDRQILSSPTGDVLVRMGFSAKNGFGVEEKFIAQCDFSKGNINININKGY